MPSFIPFPLQTLTTEENILEYYDINDISFVVRFGDLSGELLILNVP